MSRRGLCALALSLVACGSSPDQSDASTNDAGDAGEEQYDPSDWLDKPLRDQVDAMHAGKLSSAALAQAYEARIDTKDHVDGGTHAVLVVDPAAMTNAGALDALHDTTALLYGASILVKDNIDTQGIVTTAGSLAMTSNIPAADATVMKKLHDARGLLLGKTNLSEWANFRGDKSISGWSSYGGQTANGRNTAYNPCGSSAGSAAAVALGLASAALGTETNGSIVCPSSINGVVGFKPTVGLVSRTGVIPISSTQDTVGPITKTVGDAARMMSALAGPDASDPATSAIPSSMSLDFEAPLATATLSGKRFGVVSFGFSAQVMTVFNAERSRLVAAGATVVSVNLDTQSYGDASFTVLLYEFKAGIDAYLGAHPAAGRASLQDLIAFDDANAATVMPYFGQEVFVQAEATTNLSDPTYSTAKQQAHDGAATNGIDAVMTANSLDALISPTAGVAWPLSTSADPNFTTSSAPAAVAGYPRADGAGERLARRHVFLRPRVGRREDPRDRLRVRAAPTMKLAALSCVVIACSAEQPRAVTIAHEEQRPVATVDGSLLAPRAPPEEKNACLMLFECGCNAGCTKIDHAMQGLKAGMQVAVASGPLKGTSVFVTKQQTQSGDPVLTIQRADPNAPIQICSLPGSSTLGYLCATSGFGAARACTTCD